MSASLLLLYLSTPHVIGGTTLISGYLTTFQAYPTHLMQWYSRAADLTTWIIAVWLTRALYERRLKLANLLLRHVSSVAVILVAGAALATSFVLIAGSWRPIGFATSYSL